MFKVGDKVNIKQSYRDLRNASQVFTGVIQAIALDICFKWPYRVKNEDGVTRIFSAEEIEKVTEPVRKFKIGDKVKVITGMLVGATGVVSEYNDKNPYPVMLRNVVVPSGTIYHSLWYNEAELIVEKTERQKLEEEYAKCQFLVAQQALDGQQMLNNLKAKLDALAPEPRTGKIEAFGVVNKFTGEVVSNHRTLQTASNSFYNSQRAHNGLDAGKLEIIRYEEVEVVDPLPPSPYQQF